MSKIEIREKLFPFECGHPKCEKIYEIEQFKNIALLWGFIYFTHGEVKLVGLTCPHCYFTTLNKYKYNTPDFSIKLLKEHNAPKDFQGKTVNTDFTFFVPFSPQILIESKLLSASDLKQMPKDETAYHLPDFVKPRVEYPDQIKSEFPYSVTEESIPNLCLMENKKNLKAIPRIVSPQTVYQYTDNWLNFSSVDQIPFNRRQFIDDQFESALRFNI